MKEQLSENEKAIREADSRDFGGLLLKATQADSPLSTEFHRLYSRLMRLETQQKLSVLLVTSARREEGKTTTSALLAYTAAAHSDKRVVAVDCDLRKPRLHELFGVRQRVGMADVLASLLPVNSVIKNTALPNLKVVTSGRGASIPTTLFESSVFKETLAELRASFDLVVIDSAPVLPVSDAFLISGHCDGVLLVVMAGKTPIEVVSRAGDLLNEGGGKILGAVVNNAEEVLPYYYNYEYYRYEDEKRSAKG